jgi:hypothetical protein
MEDPIIIERTDWRLLFAKKHNIVIPKIFLS